MNRMLHTFVVQIGVGTSDVTCWVADFRTSLIRPSWYKPVGTIEITLAPIRWHIDIPVAAIKTALYGSPAPRNGFTPPVEVQRSISSGIRVREGRPDVETCILTRYILNIVPLPHVIQIRVPSSDVPNSVSTFVSVVGPGSEREVVAGILVRVVVGVVLVAHRPRAVLVQVVLPVHVLASRSVTSWSSGVDSRINCS